MYKEVVGYRGYFVSEDGEIITSHKRNGKTKLKPYIDKDGYARVALYSDKDKRVWIGVHKVVALAFVGGYSEGLVVNHKDYNKLNNKAENLEWVTPLENAKYSMANILRGNQRLYKPVVRIDDNGSRVEYPSMSCAARVNSLCVSNIRRCLNGGTQKCGGYKWEYLNG